MSLDYIRKTYGVPAYRGRRVRFDGKLGTIKSGSRYIHVLFDGDKHCLNLHPTWDVEYLESGTKEATP